MLKAGDTWFGSNAEIIVDSNGASVANPIIIGKYGSGNDPILCGSSITTSWTSLGGGIYRKTGLYGVIKTVGVDGTYALVQYNSSTLPAGTFYSDYAGTVYIRLSDDSNPSGHTIYVPTFQHSFGGDGGRGLVSGSNNSARGDYLQFNNLKVMYANGVGMSSSGQSNYFNDCTIIGCGQEGLLFYSELTGSGENAAGSRAYRCTIQYSAAGGPGYGQGVSTYAPQTWFISCTVDHNYMAGIDFLDFNANTNVTESGAIYCDIHHNGLSPVDPSYDANIYIDGGSEILIYGCKVYGGGIGSGTAGNNRDSIRFGSEHADVKPVENIYIINNLVYSTNWTCFGSGHSNGWPGYGGIVNIFIINNTLIAKQNYASGKLCFIVDDHSTIANSWAVRNNIFVAPSNGSVNDYMDSGTYFDADYNCYYVVGGGTTLYYVGGVGKTLAQWRTDSGEDLNSIIANPRFVTFDEDNMDVHLQRTALGQSFDSPCSDAGMVLPYTPPSWIATAAVLTNNGAVVGSTRSDGVSDDVSSFMDIGYHYYVPTPSGSLTNTNVQPGVLNTSTSSTVTVSFTLANALASDGKIVVTFPTSLAGGFTFNDPSTTTAAFTVGGSGSLAVSISSNVITLTRSGGSTINAATAVTLTITNVVNPSQAGSTGAYQIKTTTSADASIDVDTNVSPDTIIFVAGFTKLNFQSLRMEKLKVYA